MASEQVNRQVILNSRPQGYPTNDNFKILEGEIRLID